MRKGFNEYRVMRLVGALIFAIGAIIIFFAKVLDLIVTFADSVVVLAISRYSNFTGRLAIQNFKEDKELWVLLESLSKEMLPMANVLIPILFFIAVFIMLLGVSVIAFPRYASDLFVSLKVLKKGCSLKSEDTAFESMVSESVFKVLFKWLISIFVLLLIFISTFLIFRCATDDSSKHLKKNEELMSNASSFIESQNTYFIKNQSIASEKKLEYKASESKDFIYSVSAGGANWIAKNKRDWDKCPANSEWKISVEVTGFFEKKLQVYRRVPKNLHCADMTPDFKNVGRDNSKKNVETPKK